MAEQPAQEDQAEEGQAGKERQESLWASFTRDDMKLFLVTFAGTVAANIVTVMVVAVAVIFARHPGGPIRGHERPSSQLAPLWLWWFVLGTIGAGGGLNSSPSTVRFRRFGVKEWLTVAEREPSLPPRGVGQDEMMADEAPEVKCLTVLLAVRRCSPNLVISLLGNWRRGGVQLVRDPPYWRW
jgi:hypothetical protein